MDGWRVVVVGCVLLGTGLPGQATPRLAMRLPSHFATAPADMQVTLRIPRHPDNRLVVLRWDSPDGGDAGRSDQSLDGDASPPLVVRTLRRLSAGHYEIEGALYGEAYQVRAQVTQRFRVLGRGEDQ
jgi:hypothetical protein